MLFLFSTIVTCNLIFYFFYERISNFFKLIDYTDNNRKIHFSETPRSGGIFFWLTLTIIFIFEFTNQFFYFYDSFLFSNIRTIISFYLLTSAIFFLGLFDDRYNLSAKRKMFYSTIIIFIFLNLDPNFVISELRFSTFDKVIFLGEFKIIFTLLCLLLLINAINMFDGMNLQVGIYLLLFFLYFILNSFLLILISSLLIPLLFYLILNARGKLFLGDCGSLLCGILIGLLIIRSYNLGLPIYCDQIFLILLIPGIDMLRVSILRIIIGKSMFDPDQNHIHHILLRRFNYIITTTLINLLSFLIFIMLFFELNSYIILFFALITYFVLINLRKRQI